MSIYSLITNTLAPTNVPVSMRNYTGDEDTYITFFVEDFPDLHADDLEQMTGYYIQLDVFSKGNYNDLVDQVKDLLVEAGFNRMSSTDDPYSHEVGMFHKVMRFSYSAPSE